MAVFWDVSVFAIFLCRNVIFEIGLTDFEVVQIRYLHFFFTLVGQISLVFVMFSFNIPYFYVCLCFLFFYDF